MVSTDTTLLEVTAQIRAHQIKFIINIGIVIAIIPKLTSVVIHLTNISIISTNGEQIKFSGQTMMNVVLHNLR